MFIPHLQTFIAIIWASLKQKKKKDMLCDQKSGFEVLAACVCEWFLVELGQCATVLSVIWYGSPVLSTSDMIKKKKEDPAKPQVHEKIFKNLLEGSYPVKPVRYPPSLLLAT